MALTDTDKNNIIFATNEAIIKLRPVPTEEQIHKLLLSCKIQEALEIRNKNIDPADPQVQDIYEQFHLDAAWALFRHKKFSDSTKYFAVTNYDARELMLLFPELCP